METFEDAQRKALTFRDEREWKPFHNPKDLALSICLESAELLECFQWSGSDVDVRRNREHMEEELADVLMYAIYMADAIGCDIPDIIERKLRKNGVKYPVDQAKGSSRKYTELNGGSTQAN